MSWLLVALGGALGSLARYGVGVLLARPAPLAFPWSILAVNVLGSALGGAFLGLLVARPALDTPELRVFFGVGVLGGFTTFSAFGADTFVLAQGGRLGLAFANVAANVVLSLAAVALGWSATRAWLA